MAEVVALVKGYWEKYPINKDNIQNPTPEFVTAFYNAFLNELASHVYAMCNFEFRLDDSLEKKGYDHQWVTYHKMAQVFSRFTLFDNKHKFTLYDVLKPTSKRTKTFITICMNFLENTKALLQSDSSEIKDVLDKKKRLEDASATEQELLEQINETSRIIALLEEENQTLETKREKLVMEREAMIENRSVEEDVEAKKGEIKKLKQENQHLLFELKTLRDKYTTLSKQTVTVEEFERLQNRLQCFREEEQIKVEMIETLSEDSTKKLDSLAKANEILSLLENFKLDVEQKELLDNEKKAKRLETTRDQLMEKLQESTKQKQIILQEIEQLEAKLGNLESQSSSKLTEQQQTLKKLKNNVAVAEKAVSLGAEEWQLKIAEEKKQLEKETNYLERLKTLLMKERSEIEELIDKLIPVNTLI